MAFELQHIIHNLLKRNVRKFYWTFNVPPVSHSINLQARQLDSAQYQNCLFFKFHFTMKKVEIAKDNNLQV